MRRLTGFVTGAASSHDFFWGMHRTSINASRSRIRKRTFFPTLMCGRSRDFMRRSIVARDKWRYSAASAFVNNIDSGIGGLYPQKMPLDKVCNSVK